MMYIERKDYMFLQYSAFKMLTEKVIFTWLKQERICNISKPHPTQIPTPSPTNRKYQLWNRSNENVTIVMSLSDIKYQANCSI